MRADRAFSFSVATLNNCSSTHAGVASAAGAHFHVLAVHAACSGRASPMNVPPPIVTGIGDLFTSCTIAWFEVSAVMSVSSMVTPRFASRVQALHFFSGLESTASYGSTPRSGGSNASVTTVRENGGSTTSSRLVAARCGGARGARCEGAAADPAKPTVAPGHLTLAWQPYIGLPLGRSVMVR